MTAVALLKFQQGSHIGSDGQAFIASTGTAVTIENSDNTDVASWRIELLYGPPRSSFEQEPGTPLVLAQNAGSSTPSTTVIPQEGYPGCYRIRLTVWESAGYTGNSDIDIRNIAISTQNRSIIIPPYQKLPDPVPLLGTGKAGEKPSELNFEGQSWGWAGGDSPNAKLLNDSLSLLDELMPIGGEPYDVLQQAVTRLSVQYLRRADTIDGTNMVVGGDPAPMAPHVFYRTLSYASSVDGVVTVNKDPMGSTYGVAFVLYDADTDRTFMVGSSDGTNMDTGGTGRREVSALNPLTTIGSAVGITNGGDPLINLADALSPGNGCHYYVGSISGTWTLLAWDIASNTYISANTLPFYTTSLSWDGDVAKYGDSNPRIILGTYSNGVLRLEVDASTGVVTSEIGVNPPSGTAPGGGGGWAGPYSRLTTNGVGNAGYIIARNTNNDRPYLIKWSLEPFGVVAYSIQLNTSEYYEGGSVAYDPVTQRVIVAGTVNDIYIFQDTGSSFTLVGTYPIPSIYGVMDGGVPLWSRPQVTVIQGKACFPMTGTGMASYPRRDSVLFLDVANPGEFSTTFWRHSPGWGSIPFEMNQQLTPFTVIYVDLDGNGDDNNNGTEEAPLATIEAARARIGDRNGDFQIEITGTSGRKVPLLPFSLPRKGLGRTKIEGKSFIYSYPTLTITSIANAKVATVTETLTPGELVGQFVYCLETGEARAIVTNTTSTITIAEIFEYSTESNTFRVGYPAVSLIVSAHNIFDTGSAPSSSGSARMWLSNVDLHVEGGNAILYGSLQLDAVSRPTGNTLIFQNGFLSGNSTNSFLSVRGGGTYAKTIFINTTGDVRGYFDELHFLRSGTQYFTEGGLRVSGGCRRLELGDKSRVVMTNSTIYGFIWVKEGSYLNVSGSLMTGVSYSVANQSVASLVSVLPGSTISYVSIADSFWNTDLVLPEGTFFDSGHAFTKAIFGSASAHGKELGYTSSNAFVADTDTETFEILLGSNLRYFVDVMIVAKTETGAEHFKSYELIVSTDDSGVVSSEMALQKSLLNMTTVSEVSVLINVTEGSSDFVLQFDVENVTGEDTTVWFFYKTHAWEVPYLG